jgi:predicted RNA binding protein YcfA (HicA-like mRNA interferase family)
MKEKVINYLKSLGFEAISHNSSKRQIFHNKNITVTVEEQVNNKILR